MKKNEADKRRMEKEIEAERVRLNRFEASQKAALEKQAKELEAAQRKFAAEQAKAMTEQQKREHMLKVDADQQKAVLARKQERDAFLSQQKNTAKNTRELKKNLHGYSKQVKKNQEMTMKVEDLKKKSSLFSFKKSMTGQSREARGERGQSGRRASTRSKSRPPSGGMTGQYHSSAGYAAGTEGYYDGGYGGPSAFDFRDDVDYGGGGGYRDEVPHYHSGRVPSEDISFDI